MKVKIVSIEKKEIGKHEHKVEYSLDDQLKSAMLIEPKNNNEEYKMVFNEQIQNGDLESLVKQMIILVFKEENK